MNNIKFALAKHRSLLASSAVALSLVLTGCNNSQDTLSSTNAQDAELALASGGTDVQIVKDLPPPDNTRGGSDIQVSENDLLEVDVFQVDDLDRTVRVDARGAITLPLIGQLKAAGRTVAELETDIERRYGSAYLQNPDVTIFVKESAGQRVTIDGEVKKAGILPTDSNTTLLEVISQAGGFSDIADPTKIFVYRSYGEKKLAAQYNVTAIRGGKVRDPRIFGGDTVVVFTSSAKVSRKNLSEALNIAGGIARVVSPF